MSKEAAQRLQQQINCTLFVLVYKFFFRSFFNHQMFGQGVGACPGSVVVL
jgi:hypothetical protein